MMKYLLKTMISMLIIFILPLTITSTIGSDFGQDAIHAVPVSGNALAVSGIMNNTAPSYTGTTGKEDMRGLWVASVVNIDYPSKPTADPELLKSEALKILDDAVKMGMNAVFLQVRPTADAFYKSGCYPWSKYLTGIQGKAPDNGFDPLAYWITEAHNRGIELHAWVNPYRITKKTAAEANPALTDLYSTHPARLHPEWVVKYSDNNLYFNPGIPEVQNFIVNSVLEIINNYDVDGIHFDDYFYPGKNFDDAKTYAVYGREYTDIGEWRRANVNKLLTDVSKAIRATGKNIRFGVSPFGIWANKSTNPLGSDTKGLESNYDHYADSRKWVKDGIIDYIAPQIYWNIGYSAADYSKLLTWWKDVVSGTNVDLYIGQAAYKACNSSSASAWYGVAEIEKQLLLNEKTQEVKGSIFYNYKSLADNPGLGATIRAIYDKQDGKTIITPVTVSRPSSNIKTSYSKYYLNGASDPGKPLYLNGEPVENRSSKGYFGLLVSLKEGSNIFTFSQDGSYAARVIYRTTGSTAQVKMSSADITASSVFPQSQEYRMPGEKITLSCQAPTGSKVTVKIGGKTYAMKSSASSSSGSSLYPARYTYTYTIPSYSGTPRNIDLGVPAYTMNYKGTVKTRKAPAKIGVIMKGSPFYAEVSKEDIDTYKTANSSNGAAYELRKGMVDYVTGMTGSYARLSSGLWVRKTSVATYSSKAGLSPAVKTAVYNTGAKWDTLKLDYSSSLAATSAFDGSKLTISISAATSGVISKLPADSLFSSVTFNKKDSYGQYVLVLKPGQTIDGYYIEKTASGILLHVKRHAKAAAGGSPLKGITIMLDPGHGGSDTGAIGPLGLNYAEETINLNTALKLRKELEALGAKVLMTRTTDVTLSLSDRLTASRNALPDMFLSIHANSMEDNVDISRIDGFSVHYKETLAAPLSEILLDQAVKIGRTKKGIRYDNFYVVRGTWTPSMLIENGFVPNPNEFELLTSDNEQTKLAKSLAEGIAQYFAP
ncbi:MAG: family 10 glycosylhydrolase [Clostridiaceae bacterium]